MIQLTNILNNTVWVEPEHIVLMEPHRNNTTITLRNDRKVVVLETPRQIHDMIRHGVR